MDGNFAGGNEELVRLGAARLADNEGLLAVGEK